MKIHTIDLNFQNVPQTIAAYVVMGPDGPVLVETGPGSTLPVLLAELDKLGIQPGDIKQALVTHIHFDHAGAAGWWASQGAHVYVHYFGARHLIAPEKLIASATRIYGDKMDTLWGQILPAPEDRVTAVHDGDKIQAGGLTFTAMDTPGHARHHHVYRLGDIAFSGDAAGINIPGKFMADLPAPPPEFDLEAWLKTVDLLLAQDFTAIYPTHYGRLDNWREHLAEFRPLLQNAADFVKEKLDAGVEREQLLADYTEWNLQRAKAAGLTDAQIHKYITANPLDMSVDGIIRYWRKKLG
ncbi:MAG: MBL fold metallo-hydrolase [Anaerolineae bacterium]